MFFYNFILSFYFETANMTLLVGTCPIQCAPVCSIPGCGVFSVCFFFNLTKCAPSLFQAKKSLVTCKEVNTAYEINHMPRISNPPQCNWCTVDLGGKTKGQIKLSYFTFSVLSFPVRCENKCRTCVV